MEQKHAAMRIREIAEQIHEFSLLFALNEQVERSIIQVRRGGGKFLAQGFIASVLSPALDALLVGDAEEPASEFRVIAQAANVTRGVDERFLHDIEAGLFVADQLKSISV